MPAVDHSDLQVHRDLGELSAEVRALKDEMSKTRTDLKEVRDALLQARGGWKMIAALAGVSGGVTGLIGALFGFKAIS